MTTRRASLISGIGIESLVIATLVMGCSSSTTNNNPSGNLGGSTSSTTTGGSNGNGGGTGASVGGTPSPSGGTKASVGGGANPTGGAATVATGGSVSAPTGGAATVATGGAVTGTDTGGTNGTTTGGAATSGTGGSTTVDCKPPVVTKCTGTAPAAALISDFTATTSGTPPATSTPVFGSWSQAIYGGTYIYPTSTPACGTGAVDAHPLTMDVSGGSWLIQGTVGTYSGAGLWWQCNTGTSTTPSYAGACAIDASAYTGISFTVSGTIGPVSSGTGTVGLTMQVSTPSTQAPTTDSAGNPSNCGTCTATNCGTNVAVPVTATASTVTLTWAQLGVTTPNAITSITFAFTDPFGLNNGYATTPPTATPFPVNISIDNIQFTM